MNLIVRLRSRTSRTNVGGGLRRLLRSERAQCRNCSNEPGWASPREVNLRFLLTWRVGRYTTADLWQTDLR